MSTRLPPQNRDAEKALLGSILIDNEAYYEVAEIVTRESFYLEAHGEIFAAMGRLSAMGMPMDAVTLPDELTIDTVGSEDALIYIIGLTSQVPTAINAVPYAKLVYEAKVRRDLLKAASEIAKLAYDEELLLQDVKDRASSAVYEAIKDVGAREIISLETAAKDTIARIEEINEKPEEERMVGLPTGIKDLDTITKGLKRGQVSVIGARPGMGKSSTVWSIVNHIGMVLNKSVYCSLLESGPEEQTFRHFAGETGIEMDRLQRAKLLDHEWSLLYEAAARTAGKRIYIDDSPRLTPTQLRNKARRHYLEHGLDLIVIDYVQLMDADHPSNNRTADIANISRQLTQLAKELDVHIMIAAQLNRGVESRQDKRPLPSDLKESGALEQDARLIMLLYREEYYNGILSEKAKIVEINVAKNNNGQTAQLDAWFDAPAFRVKDIDKMPAAL